MPSASGLSPVKGGKIKRGPYQKHTAEQKKKAIRLAYVEHTQVDEIAEKLGYDPKSLRRFLRDFQTKSDRKLPKSVMAPKKLRRKRRSQLLEYFDKEIIPEL